MTATARKILLAGDLTYYEKLKSLCAAQDIWDKSYPDLLGQCGKKLHYLGYMEILSKENECALLLEQVKKHMKQVYLYGKLLVKEYPDDVRSVFTTQIAKEAEAAYGRDDYRVVCSHISCFSEAGYKADAAEMIAEYKLKYKRKPAFVDELKNIGGQVKCT